MVVSKLFWNALSAGGKTCLVQSLMEKVRGSQAEQKYECFEAFIEHTMGVGQST